MSKVTKEQLEAKRKSPHSRRTIRVGNADDTAKAGITYLGSGWGEGGPFQIRRLRLGVHQDLCEKRRRRSRHSEAHLFFFF